ncbi:MAG: ABC transporter ATP-binding protein [Anaerolineales bacterium]|nr:ABC transporter ATP-binding protein [Anaerolineales bacterium]
MIQTEDLSKQFGNFWAVDGVNLDVQPGQVLALLGQNGAGKTTSVRMLTSVLIPTRGQARVAGYDVVSQADHVRSSVGVLTEQHGLYLRMTGREYLDYFGRIYRLETQTCHQRCLTLLDYFGLGEAAGQRIGQYSKGMRQKLAIARALMHTPPVLLLDEPTSAMDPESAHLVRQSIAGLRAENRTIIICTHNLVEAEMLANRIAIIYRGRIIVEGTVEALKQQLLGPPEYEVQTNNGRGGGSLHLPDGVELLEESEGRLRFRVRAPKADNPVLLKHLLQAGIGVVSLQEVPRSLEQIYLAAMKQVRNG